MSRNTQNFDSQLTLANLCLYLVKKQQTERESPNQNQNVEMIGGEKITKFYKFYSIPSILGRTTITLTYVTK